MALLWVCVASFLASSLTLYSGFGLGTILMPVVAVFLPVPVAIAVTAAVHLLSKVFKLLLFWRHVDRRTLVAFGLPAMCAAVPGAILLEHVSRMPALGSYALAGSEHVIYPVKLLAGVLLIFFATSERIPLLKNAFFRRIGQFGGGLLSGFFGGLTGHQGAFRSAFLIQGEYSNKGFVATNAAIAILVDSVRLVIYGFTFDSALIQGQGVLISAAIAASFAGTFAAAAILERMTVNIMRHIITLMMYALGLLLCAGFI